MSTKLTMVKERLTPKQLIALRARLITGSFGWIIYESGATFTPVFKVLNDPENGPVVLISDDLYEVDVEETTFYPTEDAARDAYWKMDQKERPGTKMRSLMR